MAIFKEPEIIEKIGIELSKTKEAQQKYQRTTFPKAIAELRLALAIRDASFSIMHIGSTAWYDEFGKAVEAHHQKSPQIVFSAISRNELNPNIIITEGATTSTAERYHIAATALSSAGHAFEERTIDDVLYCWTEKGLAYAIDNFKKSSDTEFPCFPQYAGPILRFTPDQAEDANTIMIYAQNSYLNQVIDHPDTVQGKKVNFAHANILSVQYDIGKLASQHEKPITITPQKQQSIMLSVSGRHRLI